jgi:iron(III) transport system permease protein
MTQEGTLPGALKPVKDPLPILLIACCVRQLPYVVRSAAAGFQQTSVTLKTPHKTSPAHRSEL